MLRDTWESSILPVSPLAARASSSGPAHSRAEPRARCYSRKHGQERAGHPCAGGCAGDCATHDHGRDSVSIGLILLGFLGVVAGARAYAGRWRSWAERTGYSHSAGFAALYAGCGAIALGVFLLSPRDTISPVVALAVGIPLLWCGIIGFWWLPGFMLPSWFRDGRAQRRRGERSIRETRAQAQAGRSSKRGG